MHDSAREENRERAAKAIQDGSNVLAHQFFQKSVEITHEMAHKLLLELQSRNIAALVAPYEADAQLAYLSKAGLVDFVITEDSDVVPFGCKRVSRLCLDVFFSSQNVFLSVCSKWTRRATDKKYNANIWGVYIISLANRGVEPCSFRANSDPSFLNWSEDMVTV